MRGELAIGVSGNRLCVENVDAMLERGMALGEKLVVAYLLELM